MKKLLLLSSCLILILSCGIKQRPVEISPIHKAFNTEGSKEELFVEAANWMTENFTDPRSIIQFKDKEEGMIVGKYLLNPLYKRSGYTVYESGGNYAIIRIQTKDGGSKITVAPQNFIEVKSRRSKDPIYGKGNNDVKGYSKQDALLQINQLLTSYEEYLKRNSFSF